MSRIQASGAQKRKFALEKKHKESENLNKIPKLTNYFAKKETVPIKSELIESADENELDDTRGVIDDADLCGSTFNSSSSDECELSENEAHSEIMPNHASDPGLWNNLSKSDIQYWVSNGPSSCQNNKGPFENSARNYATGSKTRHLCDNNFYGIKPNKEKYLREWMIYSPTKGVVFCFVCRLFRPDSNKLSSQTGFNDWRNMTALDHHENSETHNESLMIYITRRQKNATLPDSLGKQIENEGQYWRQVLERAVAVIVTLAGRGLAFRGENEKFGSPNNGNYLEILEVIAKFDPFLASHIARFGNKGKGTVSYLSKNICEEIIGEMGHQLHLKIIEEVKLARYFSLSVDSTPDLSHVDQLSIILRYVAPTDGKPVERFLTFLNMHSHTGQHMARLVIDYLQAECGLDFLNCRGQSYDNAANMSGKYNGMQSILLKENIYSVRRTFA